MNWSTLLHPARIDTPKGASREMGRTPFEKDYDKVVFSPAFRRLDRKTQVHPLPDNDHIHTRMTHSIEVASIGRTLGTAVGDKLKDHLPETIAAHDVGRIVQVACLAHDIGNPPFGHAGEYVIRDWFTVGKGRKYLERFASDLTDLQMADLQFFEGNAQGFRIITQLEYRRFSGGMHLTYPVLGAFTKYPWDASLAAQRGGKFGYFQSEATAWQQINEKMSLIGISEHETARHPLVYLMEAADDICYDLMDLEDGVEMGLLRFEEAMAVLEKIYGRTLKSIDTQTTGSVQLAHARGLVMNELIHAVVESFVDNEARILAGEFEGSLLGRCEAHVDLGIEAAKNLAREHIFSSQDKREMEIGASTVLDVLLARFVKALYEQQQGTMRFESERLLELMGSHAPHSNESVYQGLRRILDFISGMTDKYAISLARRLRGLT